ncbi:DMT family transporter [Roseibacterium sp. SDUM158016]|uniref:DMT family transporter n=1 Tax=Roseicyclus sediminis TaxID=2980997 RepID=UPI0021CF3E5F|nr:DMT family transporter [Roseibacterium sp. SDUM158016]MCU4651906.1 DMT family transporter [Roseibacterium sp. SDUM158016]
MRYGTGVALVSVAAILWSLQGLVFRQIEEASPWAILFWRSVGMMPVLLAFLAWRGRGRVLPGIKRAGLAGVLGGLGLVAAFGGAVYAIQVTTIANAVFMFAATPFLTALAGWAILGERVGAKTWLSIAIAVAGIYVMMRGGLANGVLAGNIAALISAAGFAAFTVSLRWRAIADTLPTVLLGGLFAIAGAGAMTAVSGGSLAVPVPDALWAMGMGAVLLSGGMVLFTLGSRVVPAADLALLTMIEVMLAPMWVWLALGETASRATLMGGIFILGALAINGLWGGRRRVSPA